MLPFPILFENNYFIIINKPSGMPVYTTKHTQQAKSVEDFFPLLSKRKEGPWLVHRLDQDTAGCLLIALRKQALIQAQRCFEKKQVTKTYWAIVQGKPKTLAGTIQAPLLKTIINKTWKIIVDPKGQKAITMWKLLGSNGTISCLELTLLTGRTHQARVHCAYIGHPIVGDPIYSPNARTHHSLQLLSRSIQLPLSPPLHAVADPELSMRELLKACNL
ncbi:RluA family pseudouridine synthase [Commensalibacter oyaizuii]|uniref:RNA pseudouridine synthase n=1 Tax=Commensalibacter oyaizuii TaxID=3043873 RepID=A0ABT6Q277_9PROT|nr:RNA pseudouridine synthase [Commensalibacter sp. TBRC 16381]MDI2091120.1 RNA pseudouridine synthase [Commensalibacter sp. TBRC 16381]